MPGTDHTAPVTQPAVDNRQYVIGSICACNADFAFARPDRFSRRNNIAPTVVFKLRRCQAFFADTEVSVAVHIAAAANEGEGAEVGAKADKEEEEGKDKGKGNEKSSVKAVKGRKIRGHVEGRSRARGRTSARARQER